MTLRRITLQAEMLDYIVIATYSHIEIFARLSYAPCQTGRFTRA